jgi:putative PIN family toxin of toxin-antitoxin system
VRVFLDTNVVVSAVGTRGLCADVFQAVLAEHDLVVGQTVLTELQRVLPKKMRLSLDLTRELEVFLRQEGDVVAAHATVSVKPRDPDDLAVLAEATAARVDVLVTGDQDLLVLDGSLPFRILSPRGFWDYLRSGHATP